MSRFQRSLPFLLVALGLAVLLAPMTQSRADTASAPVVLLSGPDFATDTFTNPWDFADSADINLDPGAATVHTTGNKLADGMASFTASQVGYVSMLWQGISGSLPWGRDGRLARNQIVASSYSRAHIHISASTSSSIRLEWFETCSGCSGYVPLSLKAGWNDIDVSLASNAHGTAWNGRVDGLRLEIMTTVSRSFDVDFVRIYHPSSAGVLRWAAPGASAASLKWTDGSGLSGGQHGGTVPGATSSSSSNTKTTDLSGYAPGTQFFVGSSTTPVATVATEPLPVIDSPSAAGCGDYATAALGHPWNFHSSSSVDRLRDVTNVSYTSTGLNATNAAPQPNDPYVVLRQATAGIDGRRWHRLTIVESYTGTFGLANAPGGGAVARVLWMRPGHSLWAQTNDLVTPTGKQTITLDMAMPAATLTEPEGGPAQTYAFAGSTRVNAFRWDPNEDPGARRWHLYSVRLAKDCSAALSFSMTWHDRAYVAGSTATIVARSAGGHHYQLAAGIATHSGSNTFRVSTANLPASTFTMQIQVTTPDGASHGAVASGPLVLS